MALRLTFFGHLAHKRPSDVCNVYTQCVCQARALYWNQTKGVEMPIPIKLCIALMPFAIADGWSYLLCPKERCITLSWLSVKPCTNTDRSDGLVGGQLNGISRFIVTTSQRKCRTATSLPLSLSARSNNKQLNPRAGRKHTIVGQQQTISAATQFSCSYIVKSLYLFGNTYFIDACAPVMLGLAIIVSIEIGQSFLL